jgi:dCMP deaminase
MRSVWARSPNQPHQELSQFPMPPTRTISKQHLSFLSLSPITPHVPWSEESQSTGFTSPIDMLKYVTLNWRDNFVTVDLSTRDLVEKITRRPFFMLINIDAPVLARYSRSREYVMNPFPYRLPSNSQLLDTSIDH